MIHLPRLENNTHTQKLSIKVTILIFFFYKPLPKFAKMILFSLTNVSLVLKTQVSDRGPSWTYLFITDFIFYYRLRKYTSAQLLHSNPKLDDLSDINRPTKLAERFSDIYDNEWTDAFDVLTYEMDFQNERATHLLLDLLMVNALFNSNGKTSCFEKE